VGQAQIKNIRKAVRLRRRAAVWLAQRNRADYCYRGPMIRVIGEMLGIRRPRARDRPRCLNMFTWARRKHFDPGVHDDTGLAAGVQTPCLPLARKHWMNPQTFPVGRNVSRGWKSMPRRLWNAPSCRFGDDYYEISMGRVWNRSSRTCARVASRSQARNRPANIGAPESGPLTLPP